MKNTTLSLFKQSVLTFSLFLSAQTLVNADNGREHCREIEGTTFAAKIDEVEKTSSEFCANYRKQRGKDFKDHVDACAALGEGKKKFFGISIGGNKYKGDVKSFNKDADLGCLALRKAVAGVDKACKNYKQNAKQHSARRAKPIANAAGKNLAPNSNAGGGQAEDFSNVSREYSDGSSDYAKLESELGSVFSDLSSEWSGSVLRKHNRTEKNSSLFGVEQYDKKNPKSWLRMLHGDLEKSGKKLKGLSHDKDSNGWGELSHDKQGAVDKCANASKEMNSIMDETKNGLYVPFKDLLKSLKEGINEIHLKSVKLSKDAEIMRIEARAQGEINRYKEDNKDREPASELDADGAADAK